MRLRLVVATNNPGKMEEFRAGLARLDIDLLTLEEAGVKTLPAESGTTYEENALLKAASAAIESGLPALADDSGIEVDALGGAPGVYSARFGGDLSDGERIAHLLQKLRDVPRPARGAAMVCCLVLATPGGEVKQFRGECRGEILYGPRGEGGFGYDPVFLSTDLDKTFAEATKAEKLMAGHRGRALADFLEWALTPAAKQTMQDIRVGPDHSA